MIQTRVRKAFTAVELLVLVALLAVLAAMLVQSAARLRERDAQAVCLSNLHTIALASLQYAAEDPREQIVPLHRMMVSTLSGVGWSGTQWHWRTAWPFIYGGRVASRNFPTESGLVSVMKNPHGLWGVRTRPLSRYISEPESAGARVFHCPADTGYPNSPWVTQAPHEAANLALIGLVGNSYRHASIVATFLQGSMPVLSLSCGAWGHTPSSLASPLSETALYCDPLFFTFAEWTADPEPDPIPGWHGQLLSDNVAYCDGSARLTERGEVHQFTQEELDQMGVTQDPYWSWEYFLRWGPTWRLDAYPTPGAAIVVYMANGLPPWPGWQAYLDQLSGWPFENYQWNPPP